MLVAWRGDSLVLEPETLRESSDLMFVATAERREARQNLEMGLEMGDGDKRLVMRERFGVAREEEHADRLVAVA